MSIVGVPSASIRSPTLVPSIICFIIPGYFDANGMPSSDTRSRLGPDHQEEVLVTVVGTTFVSMTRATVQRRVDGPPLLGAWQPSPDSPDLEVKSWINDALQAALVNAHAPRGLSRLFRRQ